MTDAALIIASPWPRTGSANLFAAQSAYLASRGYRTAMLLSPHRPEHRYKFRQFWQSTLSAMRFEGLDLLCFATINRRMRRWLSRSYFQWLWHGRDSQLAIMARYAAAADLPGELVSFLNANVLRVLIVNHCFQMTAAENICRYLQRHGRPRPRIVLHTHDVQADLYARGKISNEFRNVPDDWEMLARDELRLSAAANVVTHLSADDLRYFEDRLRSKHHLVLATLHPVTEKKLQELDTVNGGERYDFLYIGNNSPGNEVSVHWFLTEVAPLLKSSCSFAIAGRIGQHLKSNYPEVFARFERHFLGEVDDVVGLYQSAAVVVIPTTFGTGISIKTIEALAAGKPIVATGIALRGLPSAVSAAVVPTDDPRAFAEAMLEARRQRIDVAGKFKQLYWDLLSNRRYFERWDEALALDVAPTHRLPAA